MILIYISLINKKLSAFPYDCCSLTYPLFRSANLSPLPYIFGLITFISFRKLTGIICSNMRAVLFLDFLFLLYILWLLSSSLYLNSFVSLCFLHSSELPSSSEVLLSPTFNMLLIPYTEFIICIIVFLCSETPTIIFF